MTYEGVQWQVYIYSYFQIPNSISVTFISGNLCIWSLLEDGLMQKQWEQRMHHHLNTPGNQKRHHIVQQQHPGSTTHFGTLVSQSVTSCPFCISFQLNLVSFLAFIEFSQKYFPPLSLMPIVNTMADVPPFSHLYSYSLSCHLTFYDVLSTASVTSLIPLINSFRST